MSNELGFINGSIGSRYTDYTASNNDVRKVFPLLHNGLPIFKRDFDSENPNIIDVENNVIIIPDHFFVTGEEIIYSYPDNAIPESQPIGIATTFISGIGTTDKLPPSLYVIKQNDFSIRVASSASNALNSIPVPLILESTGIGTHSFACKSQNNKVIISIDNIIQSPIVSTSSTTTLLKDITFFDYEILVDDISFLSSGDLIKINNEVMRIDSIGIGSTNTLSVTRQVLGTSLSGHFESDIVKKVYGNYNIVDNLIYFIDASFGKVIFENLSSRGDEIDYVGISSGSSFSGRVFLRSGLKDSSSETYSKNYILDDISDQFDGSANNIILKSSESNVTGIVTDNLILLVNSIFQAPKAQNYDLVENLGITSVTFSGSQLTVDNDINTSTLPRGGIIVSVGSTQGFGYQPLVSAGGTAIVSAAGTIQSISIGNSGSGYRSGIQTVVNVGVKTEELERSSIEFIGIASISNGNIVSVAITNPGVGYTSSNPPIVIFDSPLSYSNIPLIYSTESQAGVGTGAVVDIVVGQGSSVISFEIKNFGYAYKTDDILTVSVGGINGIQTTSSADFAEFQIIVDQTHTDSFSSWSIGNLSLFDSIKDLFDGKRISFPLRIDGSRTSIIAGFDSEVNDIQATLLVFINDILQVPGEGYIFNGGSTITFTEAPKPEDKVEILFYGGTKDVDTVFVDILETIKIGDKIKLIDDDYNITEDYSENERIIDEIISADAAETNLYSGPGISLDESLLRSLIWCKQTEDLIINNEEISKDRIVYEPYVYPSSYIIKNIGISSNEIFVESAKSFFDSELEYEHDGDTEKPQNKIIIISQDILETSTATAVVSSSGTISSIDISNPGFGYDFSPTISIGIPIGVGTTGRAVAVSSITDYSVSSISIEDGGFGYDSENPPSILIESPKNKYEIIDNVSYEGDFGIITGIGTTSIGIASTGIIFDFFIPPDSFLRDGRTVTSGSVTMGISGIQTGYFFIINNSNVGYGLTSLDSSGNIVGIGTTFIDNVYQAVSVSIAQTAVPGEGIVEVAKVIASVSDYNSLSGLGFSNYYGDFSWGKILVPSRETPKEFISYANVGGISTSPIVQRYNRLKFIGYSTT